MLRSVTHVSCTHLYADTLARLHARHRSGRLQRGIRVGTPSNNIFLPNLQLPPFHSLGTTRNHRIAPVQHKTTIKSNEFQGKGLYVKGMLVRIIILSPV